MNSSFIKGYCCSFCSAIRGCSEFFKSRITIVFVTVRDDSTASECFDYVYNCDGALLCCLILTKNEKNLNSHRQEKHPRFLITFVFES